MELRSLFSAMKFIILIFSFIFLVFLKKCKIKHPPGPWSLPFIGSIHQLIISREQTHHRFMNLAQKYGPLFHIKFGQVDFVVASSPSTAREVLCTHDHLLASRPTLLAAELIGYKSSGIGFSPYGPYWRQLRKICTQELFTVKKVKSFEFIRYEEACKLVEKIGMEAESPVNLTKMLQDVSNMQMARTMFGQGCTNPQRFLSAMKETIKLLPMLRVADLFPSFNYLISFFDGSIFQMKRLSREIDSILDEIIEEHSKKKMVIEEVEDLVDVLLRLQEMGDLQVPLSKDNVKAVILDLLVASSETTSNTMCWIMSELIRHPDIMEKVQTEVREVLQGKTRIEDKDINKLQYLKRVIKETLRLHPPLPLLLPRKSIEAIKLSKFTIPANARVVINMWAIARDPNIWTNPNLFWPDRFKENSHDFKGNNYEYIPFGSGRRICPGMTFAMASIEIFLALLLLRFDWKMPDNKCPEELDMDDEFDGTSRRKKDLCLIPIPHYIKY